MRHAHTILSLVLAALLGLALGACRGEIDPQANERVRVVKVRDGDTVELDDGRIVRYIGINTPEKGMPWADSATALNRSMVEGKTVKLVFGHDRVDRYGRALALIVVNDQIVNQALVRSGLAWCYFFQGNLAPGADLLLAQREAMDQHRGLWTNPSDETAEYYLASFSSFRFHRPECESVADIKHQNEVTFSAKDSAFYAGYSPCGRCQP